MSAEALMGRVHVALDTIIESGSPYHGLFPSLLDRATGQMLTELPQGIAGQRLCDRSFLGSNLMHDAPTLAVMLELGSPTYQAAAERYLQYFASQCTDTTTGLFPWGEHSFWHLQDEAVGNGHQNPGRNSDKAPTHDHLRACPLWLWQHLHAANPQCVSRFVQGLQNHWRDFPEANVHDYNRHAPIMQWAPWGTPKHACDFPRHSGFYIFDIAFAWTVAPDGSMLDQLQHFLNYWWERKRPDGLCPTASPDRVEAVLAGLVSPSQTLSLAASLLDAAELLHQPHRPLADLLRERAATYIDGFFSAPHDVEKRQFVRSFQPESGPHFSPAWGSKYGHGPVATNALTCLSSFRHTQDERLLDWAAAAGGWYLDEPFPAGSTVPAMDAGLALELLADLHDLTGDSRWLEQGLDRAQELVTLFFDEQPLPRGASGIDWYESQLGPGFLLHGLARLAGRALGHSLPPDYTAR